jgi:hypothetical protein
MSVTIGLVVNVTVQSVSPSFAIFTGGQIITVNGLGFLPNIPFKNQKPVCRFGSNIVPAAIESDNILR